MYKKAVNGFRGTAVVIDGDNLETSLKRLGLKLSNLQLFISNFLEKEDVLLQFKNREGVSFNPIVYIISKKIDGEEREEQNRYLNKLKSDNLSLIKLSVISPKRSSSGSWINCTDSEIASFIGVALLDKMIKKIILVSGDGDFMQPLKRIGVKGEKIYLVSVKESTSRQLAEYVTFLGGKVFIINRRIPGLSRIDKKKRRK